MIEIIGFGSIDFYSKVDIEQIFAKMYKNADFHNVKLDEGVIYFEMSGNKGIDYSELEKIKDELFNKGITFAIRVQEYMECEGGYYFENREN